MCAHTHTKNINKVVVCPALGFIVQTAAGGRAGGSGIHFHTIGVNTNIEHKAQPHGETFAMSFQNTLHIGDGF